MLEHLNAFFTAAHRLRRSERPFVRSGAVSALKQLRAKVQHPRLQNRIDELLNQHAAKKAKAS